MHSSERQNNNDKSDIPITKIHGICAGGLSGSTGDISGTHCRQNERGTTHINLKKLSNSTSFFKL